jgi:hypothetical protein
MNNETLKPKGVKPTEEFETDSQKIVRRHLEDENDVITDEDIRGVRIGVTPHNEGDTHHSLEELVEEIESEKKDEKDDGVDETDNPITPWDTVQR